MTKNKSTNSLISEHFFMLADIFVENVSNEKPITDVEILRVGILQDRKLKITQKMLTDMVENFKNNVVGQEISVNKDHGEGVACGWVEDLYIINSSLFAKIKWTIEGVQLLKEELYKYVSIEFYAKFPHKDTGDLISNVFTGLALTNVPALKDQNALKLSQIIDENNLTNLSMDKKCKELMEKDMISKKDIDSLMEEYEGLSDEDKMKYKEQIDKIQKSYNKTKMEKEKMTAQLAEAEKLSAQLETLKNELKAKDKANEALSARLEKIEAESVKKEVQELSAKIMLSNQNPVGIVNNDENLSKVEAFLTSLSSEQRVEFGAIIDKIEGVDLSHNSQGVNAFHASTSSEDEKAATLAKEIMSKNKSLKYHEALSQAYEELNIA